MKMLAFSRRNLKEMLRDPINVAFGLGFPIIILVLLSAINANIPAEAGQTLFEIGNLTPGIAVFGLSFISLFSGTLIAKDRSTSFLTRLFTSPLSPGDFIIGYTLPLLPLALGQTVICFACAFVFGLGFSVNLLLALIVMLPTSVMFIAIGLLCGTVFNDKQVGGICGALLTNLCGWLSGTWFSLELVGGWFEKIASALPFVHSVDSVRAAASGRYSDIMPELFWVIGYAAVLLVLAVVLFRKKMKSDNV